MDFKLTKLMMIVVLLVLAFTCYAEDEPEPNKSAIEKKADSFSVSPESESTAQLVPEVDNSADHVEAKLAKEYYKDCVQNLKWALGIIIALVVGFVGYALFKNTREYRQALADVKDALSQAREACREARGASDRAREYEEKAQERLSGIDKEVEIKLKEIGEKSKALITDMIQESEKQRETSREEADKERKASELWNKGLRAMNAKDFESASNYFASIVEIRSEDHAAYNNWGNALLDLARRKEGAESDELFRQAFEKYKKSVEIKPDKPEAYYNWGTGLSDLAKRKEGAESDELFRQSFEKYEKAVQIKSDHYKAYKNWGTALLELAKKKEDKARSSLLEEAKRKCLEAESIKRGSSSYNLACANALLGGDEEECRKWLKTSEHAGFLPTRSHAMGDSDLESMRDKEWFKQLRWADDAK